jgi:alkylated DNA repair dioxygenase AlkB
MASNKCDLIPAASVFSHHPGWLSGNEADVLFARMLETIGFEQGKVKVWGKTYDEPRKTSMHAKDVRTKYVYSGSEKTTKPFTDDMHDISSRIEKDFGIVVDTCLVNLYEDGTRNIGWHADDESGLSREHGGPHVFSVSLGTGRKFRLRRNGTTKGWEHEYVLQSGDLFHMNGDCQKLYKHSIPKEPKIKKPRISLTFRASSDSSGRKRKREDRSKPKKRRAAGNENPEIIVID